MSERLQYRDACNYGGWMYQTNTHLYHVLQTQRGYKVVVIPRASAFMRTELDGSRTWYYDWRNANTAVGPWLTIAAALGQCGIPNAQIA